MHSFIDRFYRYVKIETTSQESSENCPSTACQKNLGEMLVNDLHDVGLSDAAMDENGYVYATLPSNLPDNAPTVPTVGLIAHMDTSPALSGKDVKPKRIDNYNGGDIVLNAEKNILLRPEEFPHLKNYIGQTLITTDGTTLLGADDKAGIVEIIEAVDYLQKHPEIKHGTVKVGFTPDEEIGRGADKFDISRFHADFAYTLDGGPLGELEYENFNAATAVVMVNGKSVHPGTAKNQMINANTMGMEFHSFLPLDEVPEKTEGYEGFYHLVDCNGSVERAQLIYILRDFSLDGLQKRKVTLRSIADHLNEKYGRKIFELYIKDQYFNMKEKLEPNMYIIDLAAQAMKNAGVEPKISPIRGGTDGARLSFMGLPTPNLFTGGENFHGKYEFISVEAMEKARDVAVNIVSLVAETKWEKNS